jgi:hypothetical protein
MLLGLARDSVLYLLSAWPSHAPQTLEETVFHKKKILFTKSSHKFSVFIKAASGERDARAEGACISCKSDWLAESRASTVSAAPLIHHHYTCMTHTHTDVSFSMGYWHSCMKTWILSS